MVLDGPEGRHAATVRRTRVGEHLLLTDGAGLRVEGEVVAVGAGTLDLRVVSVASDPEPSPRFVLVQALAKNDRDDQAIEAATECGVDEVVPWQASRSVVQWRGERGEKARRKWDAVLVAGHQAVPSHPASGARPHGHDGRPRRAGARPRHPRSCCTRTPPRRSPASTLPGRR